METASATASAREVFSPFSHLRFRTVSRSAEAPAPLTDPRALERLVTRLRGVRAHVETLLGAEIRSSGVAPRPAHAASSTAIEIGTTATATTLRSTSEVNATATSYSPFGPEFSGVSSSLPTVGGTYSGANGDDTLTFRVTVGGVVGVGVLQVEVRDGQNDLVDTLDFTGVSAGTPVGVANGLTLALSSGTIVAGDTFDVTVSASVGSTVDPDAPFDGTRNQKPNFETGVSVGAGSFEVNGTPITVLADDSVNSVLQKIADSAAGVTASFDAAAERVVLTQETPGSGSSVSVGGDTSGFLAAVKLDGASPVAGTDDETDLPISSVSGLSAITSGSFEINGESIAIDTTTDSLDDVIDRINASAAGVVATLLPDESKLSLTNASKEDPLVLSDGTSNFFSALAIDPGTHEPTEGSGSARFENPSEFIEALGKLRNELNVLLLERPVGVSADTTDLVHARLREAVAAGFERLVPDPASRSILQSGLGLDFDFTERAVQAVHLDLTELSRALDDDFDATVEFLFGEDDPLAPVGLLASLEEALADLVEETDPQEQLGSSAKGLFVDTLA